MKNIAIIVDNKASQKLVICDAECREVICEHYSNEYRLLELLKTANVDHVVLSPIPGYGQAMIDTLANAGYDVIVAPLNDPAENPQRFVNLGVELLFRQQDLDEGSDAFNEVFRTSGAGKWRLRKNQRRNLDTYICILMSYYRRYCR